MPTIKYLSTLSILALAASTAFNASAADGQRVLSTKKTCQMTVPANWQIGKLLKSTAQSPDKSMSAVISSGGDDTTLAFAKSVMESSYKPVKVFEDSPRRLWYAYDTGDGMGWYVGVPGTHHNVCGAQIVFKHAATDIAKSIALSVGPTP